MQKLVYKLRLVALKWKEWLDPTYVRFTSNLCNNHNVSYSQKNMPSLDNYSQKIYVGQKKKKGAYTISANYTKNYSVPITSIHL